MPLHKPPRPRSARVAATNAPYEPPWPPTTTATRDRGVACCIQRVLTSCSVASPARCHAARCCHTTASLFSFENNKCRLGAWENRTRKLSVLGLE